MAAIVATLVPEYSDEIILSDTESYEWQGRREDEEDDGDWIARSPRRQRPRPIALKKPRKKPERKDWCTRLMRQLEIRCTSDFVLPARQTRRGGTMK